LTAYALASSLIFTLSFCHMMYCLDEDARGTEEVGWLSKRKKTGNESYQHIADHVSALYVFVVVTCMEISVSLLVGYL